MNILMGINAPWVGGTRIHVLELAEALQRRGHRVLLVTDPGVLEEEMNRRGLRFLRRAEGLEPMLDLLLEAAAREPFDVIHAHPAAFIWEGALLSPLIGLPLVVTMHGEYVMQFRRTRLGQEVAEIARAVIAVSDEVKEYLKRETSLPGEKITVIRNGVNTAEYRPDRDVGYLRAAWGLSGRPVIAYAGRLESDKATAIRAAAEAVIRLAQAGWPVTGLFIGQGDLVAELESRAREAAVSLGRPVLRLTGFRRDLPDLLCLADVVVATGRSALEAMACGRPVLAAGRAGYAGLVTPGRWCEAQASNFGDHGSLPAPAPEVLEAEMQRLLYDQTLCQGLGRALRRLVRQDYDLESITTQVEELYAAVIAGPTPAEAPQ